MKKLIILICFLFITGISFSQSISKTVKLDNGNYLKISCLTDQIFRLQVNIIDSFPISSMEKYGIVKYDWPKNSELKMEKKGGKLVFVTPKGKLVVDSKSGHFSVSNNEDKLLMAGAHPAKEILGGGFGAEFDLQKDELFYGLGDTDREHIQHRGHQMRSWVSYGQAYAPAPFLMSSNGWALFVNTTFKHYYDIGKSNPDEMKIWADNGDFDVFMMIGEDYKDLLKQYTTITGEPRILPQKAYGLMYIENREVNQFELLEHASRFRQEKIPCDFLGLEPGWMENYYDPTVEINWDPKKFFLPAWFGDRFRNKFMGAVTFPGALTRIGFGLSLWTLCEFDITYEAERIAKKEFPELYIEKKDGFTPPFDESNFDAGAHEARFFNKNTVIDEPWFDHFKLLINDGVRCFKQDPAYIINEHPDWFYGNGMNDAEMHNLFQPMYQRQVYDGWKEYMNERPMMYFCTGYAGLQHYAATWAGDEGGGQRAMVSMLNHAMTAQSNVTCDMGVFSKDGIHFGFLIGWSQVNSWWDIRYPWFLGKMEKTFRYYANLRYRLMPYIYTYAHVSNQTSVPLMRPMPLCYPKDKACQDNMNQYMFGDNLLVSAFTDTIYLPEGKWIDYWSHKEFDGKQEIKLEIPEDKGGGLFIKAGAIIPEWPYVDYIGQKPIDTLTVQVYPYKESSFSLIEDEGEGFAYENGEIATTKMTCIEDKSQVVFTLNTTDGDYKGRVKDRKYVIHFNLISKPNNVIVDEKVYSNWEYNSEKKILSVSGITNEITSVITINL